MSNWAKLNEKQALKVKGIIDLMGDRQHLKINNGENYMPLVVEYLYTVPEFAGWKNLKVYSFAHYKDMHGDLARDPEMCFLYKDDEQVIYPLVVPYYFLNDTGIYTETEAINLEKKTINLPKQRELTTFFNQWLDNICYQQNIKAAEPSEKLKEVRQGRKEGKQLVNRVVTMQDTFKKYPELKDEWERLSKTEELEDILLSALDKGVEPFAEEIKKHISEKGVEYEIGDEIIYQQRPSGDMKTATVMKPLENGVVSAVYKNDFGGEPIGVDVPVEDIRKHTKNTAEPVIENSTEQKEEPMKEETTNEVLETEAAVEITNPVNWFDGDNYFKENPENILGVAYEASGRFGKVTKYKGTITDVEKIQANTEFLKPENFDNNPLVTVINPTASELITKPAAQENAKNAIEKSKKTIARKVSEKFNIHKKADSGSPLQSIYEIDERYNAHISNDDFFAFIWYRDSIRQRLSKHWYDVAFSRGGEIDNMYSEETLKKWVQNGNLFYYGGTQVKKGSTKLIPSYLYLAENIWHKEAQLKIDKEAIIELYGEEVFKKQEEALLVAFRAKYEKRLLIKGSAASDGLILLPTSNMARRFMIKTLSDEEPFVFKKVTSQSHPQYGKPHFLHPEFLTNSRWGRNKGETFEQLSLTDAYCAWLIKDKTIQFKKGTTYLEIIEYYINKKKRPPYTATQDDKLGRDKEDAQWERTKAKAKEEGDRLFLDFLNTQLTLNDRIRLEAQWNSAFNAYVPIDFNRIPVVFECARDFRNESPVPILPEKREAAAFVFSEGSGCLAYGTGIGKTYSSIFTVAQFMYAGYAKNPLFVVPNSVYKQFLAEINGLLPQFKVLSLYNLSNRYLEQLKDEEGNIKKLEPNTIGIITYDGFELIGFNDETTNDIIGELYDILNQGGIDEYSNEKAKESFRLRIEKLVGRGLRGTRINIEELGFDYMTFDEAHKMKKVFTVVKGDAQVNEETGKIITSEKGEVKRDKTPYQIQSGVPSSIALKGFMIAYYVQKQNNWGNICLLTATPFTNSPLEIFSMLSFIAYKKLKDTNMNSLQNFFDTYIDVKYELVINAKLQPQRRQVILGFNNLVALQQLVRRFINYKGESDVNTKKPNKIVLPMLLKRVGDQIIKLSDEEKVDTALPLTFTQQNLMDQIKRYVEGKVEETTLGEGEEYVENIDAEDESANENNQTGGTELNINALSDEEKIGVRILKGVSFARDLAISPYLYKHSNLGKPTYIKYVEESPKLRYIMECIKTVKQWHEDNGTPVSGQIIYMDRGKEQFKYLREYLMKECGFTDAEIGLVYSGLPKDGMFSKSGIQDRFLGKRFNEETLELEDIPDSERIKVLIGTSTIREGMNLQIHSSVLYNAAVDWNPTDAIQLDGRIHRQGNQFKNVRIAIPLMIDSMDIFIFQKLEEKTARINTLWATDGKENVLKIESFNPREAKSAMIKDEKVLAELTIKERVEDMQDRVGGIESEMKRIDNMISYIGDIENRLEDAVEFLSKYRELKEFPDGTPVWEKGKYLAGKMVEFLKKPTNKKGELIFTTSEWNYSYKTEIEPHIKRKEKVSEERADYGDKTKPYWFDDFNLAQRQMNKENESYLIPKKINPLRLEKYKEKLQAEANDLRDHIEKMESEENIKLVANEIREERKAAKFRIRDVHEVVRDFTKLNFLLAEKEVAKKTIPLNPPRLAANSKVKTQIKDLIKILKKA